MLTNFIRTTEEDCNYYQGLNQITWMICWDDLFSKVLIQVVGSK